MRTNQQYVEDTNALMNSVDLIRLERPQTAGQQLRSCPFCASADVEVFGEDAEHGGFYVACRKCGAAIGEGYDRDAMPDHRFADECAAIVAWNLRRRLPVDESIDIPPAF